MNNIEFQSFLNYINEDMRIKFDKCVEEKIKTFPLVKTDEIKHIPTRWVFKIINWTVRKKIIKKERYYFIKDFLDKEFLDKSYIYLNLMAIFFCIMGVVLHFVSLPYISEVSIILGIVIFPVNGFIDSMSILRNIIIKQVKESRYECKEILPPYYRDRLHKILSKLE